MDGEKQKMVDAMVDAMKEAYDQLKRIPPTCACNCHTVIDAAFDMEKKCECPPQYEIHSNKPQAMCGNGCSHPEHQAESSAAAKAREIVREYQSRWNVDGGTWLELEITAALEAERKAGREEVSHHAQWMQGEAVKDARLGALEEAAKYVETHAGTCESFAKEIRQLGGER